MGKLTRNSAMNWWNKLTIMQQVKWISKAQELYLIDNFITYKNITGRLIERIYEYFIKPTHSDEYENEKLS